MENPKYTREGLPIVSKLGIESLGELLQRHDSKSLFNNGRNALSEGNSHLFEMYKVAMKNGGERERWAIGFLTCYELLRRQSETNQLYHQFSLHK
jgi:hypothetical protein